MNVFELEWDEHNESYCLQKHSFTPELADEVLFGSPKFFPNKAGMTGTHVMIGPADDGTFWTVVIQAVGFGRWRPITGYESENDDIELYRLG